MKSCRRASAAGAELGASALVDATAIDSSTAPSLTFACPPPSGPALSMYLHCTPLNCHRLETRDHHRRARPARDATCARRHCLATMQLGDGATRRKVDPSRGSAEEQRRCCARRRDLALASERSSESLTEFALAVEKATEKRARDFEIPVAWPPPTAQRSAQCLTV